MPLLDGLGRSRSQWNILANQVQMFQLDRLTDPGLQQLNPDTWDGIHDNEANTGDFNAWNQMLTQSQVAGASLSAYMSLQGKNLDGTPSAAAHRQQLAGVDGGAWPDGRRGLH